MLIYKFTVREFDIILINHRIVHGGVNLDMTKQALHLLHRHTFVYSHSSQGTAELMRVNTYDFCQTTDFAQTGSTPEISSRLCGFANETKSALFRSLREVKYCCK